MVVIPFEPQRRHTRASVGRAASTSNVIDDKRLRLANRTKSDQRPGGIPRRRQVLTVESSTSRSPAKVEVPPNSSMIASGVMPTNTSWQNANRQGLAKCQLTDGPAYDQIVLMSQPSKVVGDRIRRTREALGMTPTAFSKLVGTDKGTYSKIENGERNFTLPMAIKLKRKKGIPLDWVYCADPARLPSDVFEQLEITEVA